MKLKWWYIPAAFIGGLALHKIYLDYKNISYRPMILFMRDNYKKPIRAAEIGVFWGMNSKTIFETLEIEEMYLIDPYLTYNECETNDMLTILLPSSFEIAFWNLQPYLDRIHPLQMTSEEAAEYVPNELDMIYIDGNHAYEYVKKDIELYYPKIKSGGVIGGHDIFDNNFPGVTQAVYEFSLKNNIPVTIDKPDWWMVKP